MMLTPKRSSRDLVDGQRDAVERDRALGRDRPREMRPAPRRRSAANRPPARRSTNACDAVDMAEHDMAAELVAEAQRPLEIDLRARSASRQGWCSAIVSAETVAANQPAPFSTTVRQTPEQAIEAPIATSSIAKRVAITILVSPAGADAANLAEIADDAAEHVAETKWCGDRFPARPRRAPMSATAREGRARRPVARGRRPPTAGTPSPPMRRGARNQARRSTSPARSSEAASSAPPSTRTRVKPRAPSACSASTMSTPAPASAPTSMSSTPQSRNASWRSASPWRSVTIQVGTCRASATTRAVSGTRSRLSTTIAHRRAMAEPGQAAGQQRIVGDRRAAADHHRIVAGAQRMGAVARQRAGDPLALAGMRRDAAVERRRELQRDERPSLAHAQQEAGIELGSPRRRTARSRRRCRRRAGGRCPRPRRADRDPRSARRPARCRRRSARRCRAASCPNGSTARG